MGGYISCKTLFVVTIIFTCIAIVMHQKYYQMNLEEILENQFLDIHLIPHSHEDPGWRKTAEQYYYGSNSKVDWSGVQYTIDSVVEALLLDPKRRFNYVEIYFFYKWWQQQNDKMKEKVKFLVKNGQLSFLNAGWCSNDEASPYYEDIIDQMQIGHQFLLDTFNFIPDAGWQVDTFGHSATQGALYSQMGFYGWYFARISSDDQDTRRKIQGLEMIMHPIQNSGLDNYIFTHVNYNYFNSPPGFCFDRLCNDEPIIDDQNNKITNIHDKAQELVDYFRQMKKIFRTNVLLHTFGSDFFFMNALMSFKNMDKLLDYINNRTDYYKVKIQYSTPGDYMKAVNKEKAVFPAKYDDFFPLCQHTNGYQTGVYTSRALLKFEIKEFGRYLQSARTFLSLIRMIKNGSSYLQQNSDQIEFLIHLNEQISGLNQHHDAITGTETHYVQQNYEYLMYNASQSLNNKSIFPILNEMAQQHISESPDYYLCHWNNTSKNCKKMFESLCQNKSVLITIFNPNFKYQQVIKLKVPNFKYDIIDSNNKYYYNEIICPNDTDKNDCILFFVVEMDRYSINYFKIQANNNSINSQRLEPQEFQNGEKQIKISNKRTLTIDKMIKFYVQTYCPNNPKDCQQDIFSIEYNHYLSFQNFSKGEVSGAYLFRPINNEYVPPLTYSNVRSRTYYQGSILTLIHMNGTTVDTLVHFYNVSGYEKVVEIESFVDSIDVSDNQGKEVVIDIDSDIENNERFYTDSNGLELQERILNIQPTYVITQNQKTSSNYYCVVGMIQIRDTQSRKIYSLLNDRSQGGSSLQSGRLELMIHRRILEEDHKGNGEPLNEIGQDGKGLKLKMKHYLILGNQDEYKDLPRFIQKNIDFSPLIYYSDTKTNKFIQNKIDSQTKKTLLPESFKFNNDNLKIYLRYLQNGRYILRLHNMNENQNATFTGKFNSIEERTLTANQKKFDWENKKLKWLEENPQLNPNKRSESVKISSDGLITVLPLEIRTFIVTMP